MARLFYRDFLLNAGGLSIAARDEAQGARPTLKVVFRIERSLTRDANNAEVSIWNLNERSRAFLQNQEQAIQTIIEAGYVGQRPVIFRGDLEFVTVARAGVNWITTLQSRDGGRAQSQKRINTSFKRIRIGQLLERLTSTLGVGIGNAVQKATQGPRRGNTTEFIKGIALNGQVMDEIEKIAKQMGFGVSIQDNQIQFLGPDEALPGQAVLLRPPDFSAGIPGTGLIGSPEPGDKGVVKAQANIQPNLNPGQRFQLEAAEISGLFRIQRSVYNGDTWGDSWDVTLEGKPISS